MTPQSLHRQLVENTESLTSREIVENITDELEYRLGSLSNADELSVQHQTMCNSHQQHQ